DRKNKGQCKDYRINIKGGHNNSFIDKNDIEQLLMKQTNSNIRGQFIASFKLHELELVLEKSTWISDAELYVDNQDILHVTVIGKEPVARIFTVEGNSFYIDSMGCTMPLSEKMSARVPMFTGFPDKKKYSSKDSMFLNEVRVIANFICNDSFWMSQAAQINITPERNFEMIPVVGNHLVKLGKSENIEQKFYRLMVFYKQVLSKTGFDKYKIIDVQYKGQVIASNQTGISREDSARLKNNVEKLLQQAKNVQDDTDIKAMPVSGRYKIEIDSVSAPDADLPDNSRIDVGKQTDQITVSPVLEKTEEKKRTKYNKQDQPEKRIPKAVMPKKKITDSVQPDNQ
ncbi:MAG: cell division protein FtsQ/DivIB, partial [Chitinophagaceae bacterium]